ncbi:MAG: DUF4388 domain-containing protein [Planctomycetota bacterium]
MSFQGDVAGIGLGELLQSLARGGKDGVLKLYGADLAAHLGVENKLLYLLESPEEEEDAITRRCDAAWVLDPDPTLSQHRKTVIARADRLETVYRMLEAPSLHFRFEPGPLPLPRGMRSRRPNVLGQGGGTAAENSPWGRGIGVEALLLEHARITDESAGETRPAPYSVPRRCDGGVEPPEFQAFLVQCDGQSTVLEIADRLGWPLRQAQGVITDLSRAGLTRLATAQELLGLAQLELEMGRDHRAAERIQGWMDMSPPGPLYQEDAELLTAAWESGRLGDVMSLMASSRARALVRKLDLLSADLFEQLDRWEDLAQYHPNDSIARFKRSTLRIASMQQGMEIEGGAGELVMECLRIARAFSDQGQDSRARVILLQAATTQPETPQTRTELGARLIEVGLPDEGAAWMIDAAQSLIDDQDADKAVQVLGALLKGVPDHREAQGLLARTRARMTRSRKRRKHSLVAVSGLIALSLVAVVQVHSQHDRDRKIDEVTERLANPTEALRLLHEYFPSDSSDGIAALRATLEQRQRDQDRSRRREWEDRYNQIADSTAEGDPSEAIRMMVALPSPPRMDSGMVVEWGNVAALIERLQLRLEAEVEAHKKLPITPSNEQRQGEANSILGLTKLIETCKEIGRDPYLGFAGRIEKLKADAEATRTDREERERAKEKADIEQLLDDLLAAAQFEKGSGQYAAAVATFHEILTYDDGDIEELIAEELEEAERWLAAVEKAREQAEVGDHPEAIATLEQSGLDPRDESLRWRVVSEPAGAEVTLDNGKSQIAPFVLETAVGEQLTLTFRLEGYEERSVSIDSPADLTARLNRRAERSWPSEYRVEAAPTPVGVDHVVADRKGRIERVRPDGEVRWSVVLPTLAGVARTPQFLPRRPGELLVLGEAGKVWLVNAETGATEGPLDLGTPVLKGPYPISNGIAATFENGTYAIWDEGLDPRVRPTSSRESLSIERSSAYDEGNPNMMVLRSGRGLPNDLASQWTEWSVEILEDHYAVRRGGNQPYEFSIRRSGEWSFVAWEMPNSVVPTGRLWISDSEGLRSFLPTVAQPAAPSETPEGTPAPATPGQEQTVEAPDSTSEQ